MSLPTEGWVLILYAEDGTRLAELNGTVSSVDPVAESAAITLTGTIAVAGKPSRCTLRNGEYQYAAGRTADLLDPGTGAFAMRGPDGGRIECTCLSEAPLFVSARIRVVVLLATNIDPTPLSEVCHNIGPYALTGNLEKDLRGIAAHMRTPTSVVRFLILLDWTRTHEAMLFVLADALLAGEFGRENEMDYWCALALIAARLAESKRLVTERFDIRYDPTQSTITYAPRYKLHHNQPSEN